MNTLSRRLRFGLVTAVLLAAAAGPTAADWLVTTDGTRVETHGPWEVRANLIVFTNADGVLTSMRRSMCDLEASRAATEAAERAVAEPEPVPAEAAPRRPVLVLTDADVGHVRPERSPEESAPAEPPETGGVVVSSWSAESEENGVAVSGLLTNEGPNVAGNIKVVAIFRDADGDPIERQTATLSTSTLAPGQRAEFSVPPFGLFSYSRIDFDVRHFEILIARDAQAAASGGRR